MIKTRASGIEDISQLFGLFFKIHIIDGTEGSSIPFLILSLALISLC